MLQLCFGQVSPTAPTSHQQQSVASDPRLGVFNMCKECDAASWAMTPATLDALRRNDRATICWICNAKAKDEVS